MTLTKIQFNMVTEQEHSIFRWLSWKSENIISESQDEKAKKMEPSPQMSLPLFSLACTRDRVSKWAQVHEKIQTEGLG